MSLSMKQKLSACIGIVLFVFLDQFSKYLVLLYLKPVQKISLLEGVFALEYVENRGAAFGILQNQKVLFIILTIIMIILLGYAVIRMPSSKHYTPMLFVVSLLIAGAIGNFADRIFRSYVVDFLSFELIHFPVFNIADCYVTVSAVLLFFLISFYYKEEDFSFLWNRKVL